jgi:hypothetical protein
MGDQSNNFNDQATGDTAGDVVHIVDPSNSQSLGLLAKAYKDVYKPAFSPEEREPMEDWVDAMNGGNQFCDMCIVLLGEDLNSSKPTLKGISVGYYYRDQDAALQGYTVIAPKWESPDLEQALIDTTAEGLQALSRKNGGKMNAIFIEAPNPAKAENDDDAQAASERLKLLQSFGAKLVNINFIEPPLYEGADKNEGLKLLSYSGKAGGDPSAQQVKDFVTGIYTGLAECAGCAPKDNPDYNNAIREIDASSSLLAAPSAAIAPATPKKVLRFNL